MNRPRLTSTQINLMIYMALHCGAGGSVFLPRCKRDTAVSLDRRGLLAIWYRQAAHYTRAAEQKRLAGAAMALISAVGGQTENGCVPLSNGSKKVGH